MYHLTDTECRTGHIICTCKLLSRSLCPSRTPMWIVMCITQAAVCPSCCISPEFYAALPTSSFVSLLLQSPQFETAIQLHAVSMCRWCLMRWQAARWQSTTGLAAAMVRWRSCWGMWMPCWPAMATPSSLHLMSRHLSSSLQGTHCAACAVCHCQTLC